ncbi:MAG: penicillin acylase family protein [Bacteroidota bacterium]
MSTRAKVIIGLLGVAVLVGVAVFLFLRYQVFKSHPQTTGSISVPGLHALVNVHRDEFGVPIIEAADEHDLMFATGFVHAQDRLWQMDMARRIGEGRLSEIFGSVTLEFDKMFRILGIRAVSDEIERNITEESRNRLASYAEGVNAFIDANNGKYPIEFDMLDYKPEHWQPVHSIMIGRLMAWELNLSWWVDLTLGAITQQVGLEKAVDVFPTFPAAVPPVVPSGEWQRYAGIGVGFMHTAREFHEFFGYSGALGGSNAWVVAPAKSATGKVILANDAHLQLHSPAKFYEVHLRAPGYDVAGMSIPGIPMVIIGRNASIVWGLTNAMADDADFYIEQIDSTNPTRYLYDDEWKPLTIREEEIRVKDDTTVTLTIRATHHGPIVTDVETMLKKAGLPFVASMRWTGHEVNDQLEAFNKINRATNWEEFKAGVREFAGPGQNFVYGDSEGNIGYWCGLKLPIRGKQNTTLPLPGWDPSVEWKGYVPFEKLPHLFNPTEGYIATANNKLMDDSYPYHISDMWEPPSRIQRLREVLSGGEKFTPQDFERLQNDKYSVHAREFLPYILAACEDSAFDLTNKRLIIEYLRNWDFVFGVDDIATSIYQQFFVKLLENSFKDEMGEALFHDYVILVNVPIRVTTRLVVEGTSTWFDNINTTGIETRDDIIRQSMREAVEALRQRFGSEMKVWQWGELHTVTLQHPFGLQKPLDRIFNIGPFPYGGGSTTLVSGEYSYNNPFAVTVGASIRQIVDFATPGEARTILPSGQSGQVLHKHYDDQTHLWLNGGYKTVRTSVPLEEDARWQHLVLEPAR